MTRVTDDRWRRVITSLRAVVLRRGIAPVDADDVVQAALERALQRLETLETDARFEPWVHSIARNLAVDTLRAQARWPAPVDLDVDRLPEAQEDPDPILPFADCIEPFIDQLSPSDAEALRLKDLDGQKFAAVARRLGLGVPGAKSRVQRARRRLRDALAACCAALEAPTRAEATPADCPARCCAPD